MEPEHRVFPTTWRQRLNRFFYTGLSYGALFMSGVGLVVPGIPTVPFVILTVYFAEKASPTLSRTIMKVPFLGPAIRDWHEHRAIRQVARVQVLTFTAIVVVIALLTAPPSTGMYVAMALLTTLGVYQIFKIPILDEQPRDSELQPDNPSTVPIRFASV